ncbi:MAG: hypothetical protein IKE04_05500 [Oscillospiraceae bacterium]|nr:hypothetical protein [Oscillospiraceae bacterium]
MKKPKPGWLKERPPIPWRITVTRKDVDARMAAIERGEEPPPLPMQIEYTTDYTEEQAASFAAFILGDMRQEKRSHRSGTERLAQLCAFGEYID